MRKIVCLLALSLVAAPAQAALEEVVMTSEDKLASPRWMYGQGEAPKDGPASFLAAVKAAQMAGKLDTCIEKARAAQGKAKSVRAWLAGAEIDCATRLPSSAKNADKLAKALEQVEKSPEWLLSGPQAATLKTIVIKGYQVLLDRDTKTNRSRAWSSVSRLQELSDAMDDKGKARLWRAAGELAFLQRKLEAARDFLRRSLAIADLDETRSRLVNIESAIAAAGPKAGPKAVAASAAKSAESKTAVNGVASIEATREELELVDRITAALKTGDLLAGVEDAVKLIRDYPGSTRAKWAADRAIEVYLSLVDKTDPKFQGLREQLVKKMQTVDGDRLTDWTRIFYNRGQYADALALAAKGLETIDGARRGKLLELAGEAAIAVEKFETARDLFRELVDKHAGTPYAKEALLRVGLVNYRLGQHAQAIADLERLLALPQTESFEVIARYWLWRPCRKPAPIAPCWPLTS